MPKLKIQENPAAQAKFKSYPSAVRPKMKKLRALILEAARENSKVHAIEETLKWGEPSYLVDKGSTVRIDWKEKTPEQYAIYFKCTSKLVSSFREIHGDTFNYEKNRAIVFTMDDVIPEKELKSCIGMALQYHRVKNKPLLGYDSGK